MKFIALKTENGKITGKIAFCCKALEVSRQGFYEYLCELTGKTSKMKKAG